MKIKREETGPLPPPAPFCVTFASSPLSESLERADDGDVDNDANDDDDYSLQRNRTESLSLLHVPGLLGVYCTWLLHVPVTCLCVHCKRVYRSSTSLLHVCVHCTWLCCRFTSLIRAPVCVLHVIMQLLHVPIGELCGILSLLRVTVSEMHKIGPSWHVAAT